MSFELRTGIGSEIWFWERLKELGFQVKLIISEELLVKKDEEERSLYFKWEF